MSDLKKLIKSPAIGFRCQSCGAQMGVGIKRAIPKFMIIAAIIVMAYVFTDIGISPLLLVGIVLIGFIYASMPLNNAEEDHEYFDR